MGHRLTLFTAGLLLLCLSGFPAARGDNPVPPRDLGKIQPPGGVPLISGRAGTKITVDGLNKTIQRMDSAPPEELIKWVAELERMIGKKLDGDMEDAACRTYFASRVSVAFTDNQWNARSAEALFQRARTLSAAEAGAWKEALEALLKREIGQAYAVPLVLIPVEALHEGERYSAERGKKYLARLKQLAAEDLSLWNEKVDEFGGSELDAAVNIMLLDEYFAGEKFQREKFQATLAARKK